MYDPSRTKSTIPGGDTRRASGARRGSMAVQKVVSAAQELKQNAEIDDSDKKWYQKVSWACVGFAVILAIACAYTYVDVNTVTNEGTEEEKTFSEENGIYINLVTGIILVFTQYCLLAMCLISAMGWLFGRKRWWAGPYCSGFIGFGDGSAAEVPPEKALTALGIATVSKDLYFDAKKWATSDPPVRLARELVLMGYRGRSDDPIIRPGMVQTEVKMGRNHSGERSMLNLLDDKGGMGNVATRRLSMFRQPSAEEVAAREDTEKRETAEERHKKKQLKLQRTVLLKSLLNGRHPESAEFEAHLLDLLSGDTPPSDTDVKELYDTFQAHDRFQRALLILQRWFRGWQARNDPKKNKVRGLENMSNRWAGYAKKLRMGEAAQQRAKWAGGYFSKFLFVMLQSMDNGRQNYRSLKLAAALTFMGLLQVIALSPLWQREFAKTNGEKIEGSALIELTVPGLGFPLSNVFNETKGEERLWVIGNSGWYACTIGVTYVVLAIIVGMAGAGNVATSWDKSWPLILSTAWMGFYVAWLSTQWYWTTDQPIFTVMHGLLTLVAGGIFLVYLRATVKHEVRAEEHPERIALRREQLDAREKAREAAKGKGMAAELRAAAMFNPKCVLDCLARLDSGLDRFFGWIHRMEALLQRSFSNRLGQGLSAKINAFSGARFPSTLVAAATVSFVLSTLLCVGCCAVLPYMLSEAEATKATVNDLNEKAKCITDNGDFVNDEGSGDAVRSTSGTIQTTLGLIADNVDGFGWTVGLCTMFGGVVGLFKVVTGISSSIETYSRTYDLLWHHGPQALRYPLRKANSVRFFSMFVTSQLFGMCITVVFMNIVGLTCWLAWDTKNTNNMVALKIRRAIIGIIGAQLIEMLLIRTGLVPFLQKYKVGPMLFMIELFYFNISIIKGVSRIVMLVVLNLDSFYTPAKCAFPDGKESWDGGHLTFVCYAMARVDADKELQLDMSRRMLKLGIRSIGRQSSMRDSGGSIAKYATSNRASRAISVGGEAELAKAAAPAKKAWLGGGAPDPPSASEEAATAADQEAAPASAAASARTSIGDDYQLGEASAAAAVTLPESERQSSAPLGEASTAAAVPLPESARLSARAV